MRTPLRRRLMSRFMIAETATSLTTARLHWRCWLLGCALVCGSIGLSDEPFVPFEDAPFEQLAIGDPIPDPHSSVGEAEVFQDGDFHLLEEPAPAFSSGEWIHSGGWYFQEEVVLMQKAELEEQLVARDFSSATLAITNASDPSTFEPGARITLGKIYGRDVWNRDHMVEFRFLGLLDWPTQARITSTVGSNIITTLGPNAGDVAALYFNDTQVFREHSTLDNFDLNVRLRTRGSRDRMVLQHDGTWIQHQTRARIWSCYAGLTTVFVDDEIEIIGQGPAPQMGRFHVQTTNDMLGVHFGGEYVEQAALWNWGLRGRIGGLGNLASRRSLFTSQLPMPAGPTTRRESVDKDNLTFLIEGGVFASLHVHPNATIRVGYDILYLSGVAQAIGNLSLPVGSFSPMEVNDSALYHGGSVGFTMVW